MSISKDGRGRTLREILAGNAPLEAQSLDLRYNPLEAKTGCIVAFDHEPEIAGINFAVEKISVCRTKIRNRDFFHTDYHLKSASLEESPARLRLRLILDENAEDSYRVQLLYLYQEMEYDKAFHKQVMGDPMGEYWVDHDDEGNTLEKPRQYWRVEDVVDAYSAQTTADGEQRSITYWDFSRLTEDTKGQEITEFLTVEMDDETGQFKFLRGTEVSPAQITVG